MDAPLTRWYCDVCGDPIDSADDGYVVWQSDRLGARDFQIIHSGRCDVGDHDSSNALREFLGARGLTYLLAQLSPGPLKRTPEPGWRSSVSNMDQFVDFIRRVQTPYYEEARRHFRNPELRADYADANEVAPYFPEELAEIAQRYGAK